MSKNYVVTLFTDDKGNKIDNPVWHWVYDAGLGKHAFCTGEFFGFGESGCDFKCKNGKITCPDCIEKIKEIQAVKL